MNKLKMKDRDIKNKTRDLREQGFVPGVVFGPTTKSAAIKISKVDIQKAMAKKGEFYSVKSKDRDIIVKFSEVQQHPITGEVIHFSLQQLPQGQENEIEIPIHLKGEPQGVKDGGSLVVLKEKIMVSGLIKNIPDEINIDISHIKIGDKITIADLKTSSKIETTADDEEVVLVCAPPKLQEKTEEESLTDLEYKPETK